VTAINFILYFHWSGKLKIFHPAIEKRILPWSRCKLLPYWVGMTDGQRVVYFGRISGSFDLNRVHKAGAIWSEKNRWFNHQHLIKQDEDLAHTSLYRCFKGITVPENVLIKIVS
jgi:hypothetical protein